MKIRQDFLVQSESRLSKKLITSHKGRRAAKGRKNPKSQVVSAAPPDGQFSVGGNIYLLDHIARWKKSLLHFKFQAVVETESDALTLGAFHGRVDGALLAMSSEPKALEVYCCDSPNMISAVKKVCLNSLGLQADKFHADVFVTNQTAGATHPS